MRVGCRDGAVFELQVDDPKGSAGHPMTEEDHLAKFRALTPQFLGEGEADRVLTVLASLETLGSVRPLMEELREAAAAAGQAPDGDAS